LCVSFSKFIENHPSFQCWGGIQDDGEIVSFSCVVEPSHKVSHFHIGLLLHFYFHFFFNF
jgi:hypothetical protein